MMYPRKVVEGTWNSHFSAFTDLFDMQLVFCERLGENQNIIDVHKHKLMQHVPEDIVHKALEYCGGVGETKQHDEVFEVAQGCSKSRLQLVSLNDAHQMIRIAKVPVW